MRQDKIAVTAKAPEDARLYGYASYDCLRLEGGRMVRIDFRKKKSTPTGPKVVQKNP